MTLKNYVRHMSALSPVALSILALFEVQKIAGRFISGGVLLSLIPYLLGWACAVLVFKILVKIFPLSSVHEDEARAIVQVGADKKKRILTIAVATGVLVSVNLALYFVSGGGDPRGGRELLLSAVIGVMVKPVLEEFLFRYMYLKRIIHYGNGSYPVPIGVQAAFFAPWHDPDSLFFAFFGGVVLGVVAAVSFDRTENGFRAGFVNAAIVHVLHNLILYVIEGCVGY